MLAGNGGPVSIPMGDDDISDVYFDVSGDNILVPLDALLVLNAIAQINRGSEPEGETLSPWIDYRSSHLKPPTQREMIDIAITTWTTSGSRWKTQCRWKTQGLVPILPAIARFEL
jgi:hypothetical protein